MFKDIMVHLDMSPSCQSRIQAAVSLAKQHGARLTGLYVYSSPRLKSPVQQLADLRDQFHVQTQDDGIYAEFLDVDTGFLQTGIAEMVAYYASFTDLLVVSQPLTADRDKMFEAITSPERLLIGTGRPVLIIPRQGFGPLIGERVMVAWKAGPKASRATHDAMPLLRAAKYVNMVTVGESTFMPDENERISKYLSLHGVSAGFEMIPTGTLSVGDTLLNLVSDDNIDLMVLGVHIVNRRGHLDMGDIAAYLLGQMTVPMLLSH
jgi:nucleotide-binding universal stress UspA family protein